MNTIGEQLGLHTKPLDRTDTCDTHGQFTAKCYFRTIYSGCPACAEAERVAKEQQEAAEREAEILAQWRNDLGVSGIPERFWDRKVSTFVASTPEQQAASAFAKRYIEGFDSARKTGRGAIFLGLPGTGKTHLATAIGMAVMKRNGASVMFATVARAVRHVKDSWSRDSGRTESEAIALMTNPDLLILDEVGVQTGSDFEKNLLFDVINERYSRRRPTIFLSNLSLPEITAYLGERVMDRLREDGGSAISFTWDSYRKQVAQ